MAGQPMPVHLVLLERRVEPLPQIDIADRLPVGGAPAVAFPAVDPFGDAAAQVLAVRIELDRARALERFERRDRGGELPAVVGRVRLSPLELALVSVPGEHRAPAAGPRVPRAGAVGVNDHVPRAQWAPFSRIRSHARCRWSGGIAACENIQLDPWPAPSRRPHPHALLRTTSHLY